MQRPISLDEYLSENGVANKKFAEQVGASAVNVSRWRRNLVRPSPDNINLIERATKGQVTYRSWYPPEVSSDSDASVAEAPGPDETSQVAAE